MIELCSRCFYAKETFDGNNRYMDCVNCCGLLYNRAYRSVLFYKIEGRQGTLEIGGR